MSVHWLSYVWKHGPDDANDRYILLKLADMANQEGKCWPSMNSIVDDTRLSESTVRRCIQNLEKGVWLTVVRGSGRGKYSVYVLQEKVSGGKVSEGKVSHRKVSLGPKKGVTVTEPPTPPIVEEPSGTVNTLFADRPPTKTDIAKSRHDEFKDAIKQYWGSKNRGVEMPWGPAEGKQLGMWLRESPNISIDQFIGFLRARFKSDVNHGDRPCQWISRITSYGNGAIDRFGKPIIAGGSNGKHQEPSPAKQRIDGNRRAIAEALERRGVAGPWSGNGEVEPPLPESGCVDERGGIHVGLHPDSPEILPPESDRCAGPTPH